MAYLYRKEPSFLSITCIICCHPTRGAHLMAPRINPYVAQKISELVVEGMTDVQEIKRALKHYVNTVVCAQNLPSPDDRAYFPVPRDLRNHMYKAFELSKFDQHNLKLKTEEWEKSEPDSMFHFRPYLQSQKPIIPEAETEKEGLEETLL